MRQERITRTKRPRRRVEEAPLVLRPRPIDVRRVDDILNRIAKLLEVA